jgi:hypothetical protein
VSPDPSALPTQEEPAGDDEERLRKWIAAQADSLRTCGSGDAHGHAVLSLEVGKEGSVKKARLLAREALPGAVEECILSRARGFKAPVAGEERLLVNLTL